MFYWLLLSHRSAQIVCVCVSARALSLIRRDTKRIMLVRLFAHVHVVFPPPSISPVIMKQTMWIIAHPLPLLDAPVKMSRELHRDISVPAANQNKMEIARLIWEIASIPHRSKDGKSICTSRGVLFYDGSLRERRDELDGYLTKKIAINHEVRSHVKKHY